MHPGPTDHGRDADLTDEVIAAATKVFSTEATRQVTLKRVALEAHVPAQAVLERWASISDLLSDVVHKLMHDVALGFAEGPPPRHGGDLDARQDALVEAIVRISVRATLDGYEIEPLVDYNPTLARMVDHLVASGLDPTTARHRVFQLLLLEFSYRLFGEQLATACGLADEPEPRRRAEVNAVQLALPGLPAVGSQA